MYRSFDLEIPDLLTNQPHTRWREYGPPFWAQFFLFVMTRGWFVVLPLQDISLKR